MLNKLQAFSELLWKESTLEGLIKSFSKILLHYFELQHVALYRVVLKKKKIQLQTNDELLQSSLRLPSSSLNQIKRIIGNMTLEKDHRIHELLHLSLQEQKFDFVVLGYDPKGLFICLWDHHLQNKHLLDFLIKQMQYVCQWLLKIDRSQELIYIDELTGLYNYRYLNVILEQEIKRCHRYHTQFSVLFIDIDFFKQINDTYGHTVGSKVLHQVGQELKALVREVDTIIRYGGDEFIIVLLRADKEISQKVAQRICSHIEEKIFYHQHKMIKLTVSIGITSYKEATIHTKALIEMADQAMYASKRKGRNQISFIDSIKSNSTTKGELHEE